MGLLINAAAFKSVSVFTISIALAHLVALVASETESERAHEPLKRQIGDTTRHRVVLT